MLSLRHLLFIIATIGLIAALAFLYNKTIAVDLGERNEVIALLRDLQEIDSRWDVDVLRMRLEMDSGQMGLPDRNSAAQRALKALTNASLHAGSTALNEEMVTITKAIAEKAELVEKFKAANEESKGALRRMTSAAEGQIDPVVSPRKHDPRQKEFAHALQQLAAAASGYYWLEQDTQRKALENEAAHVLASARSMNAAAQVTASTVNDAAQSLLRYKPLERELFGKVMLMSSGPRLNSLAFSFNQELEEALLEKERYRIYMIAYAAALLIGIGYLGIRTVAANELLEHRVAERTSELSDALRHLKESEAQLIQSEKMSSLGQMVAGVAHEINTPLAYVNNSLTAVNDRLPDITSAIEDCEALLALLNDPNVNPDDLNRQFARVSAQLDKIRQHEMLTELAGLVKDGIYGTSQVAEIVTNLKDFSRLDRSKVSSFNLNDGLVSALGLARHMLKSIRVSKEFGQLPSITCAPSQINQVFLNLITNAAQALPAQGGEITLTSRSDMDGVSVEVADNGSGIPADVMPKIFDPFFTTKEIGKGTGLGLSISYQIIKDHGGRIDVESKVGVGTKFTVWLPVNPPAASKGNA